MKQIGFQNKGGEKGKKIKIVLANIRKIIKIAYLH